MRERPIPGPGACTLDKRLSHGKIFNQEQTYRGGSYFFSHFFSDFSTGAPSETGFPSEMLAGILIAYVLILGPGAGTLDKRLVHRKVTNNGAPWSLVAHLSLTFSSLFYQLYNWCMLSYDLTFRDMTWHSNAQ